MECKVIGFIGLDVQDTVLYLSRIFYQMGKRVLMADYSESQALYYCIPMIPGTDDYAEIIEYRGTYFTRGLLCQENYKEYDVIMIFFGFAQHEKINHCTHRIYTTDCEKNHIERLKEIGGGEADYLQLVYRNAGDERQAALGMVRESCQYSCNDSTKEKKLRIQCQYNEIFSFRGISSNFKRYLEDTVRAVFPEESAGKEFAEHFRRAQQGE